MTDPIQTPMTPDQRERLRQLATKAAASEPAAGDVAGVLAIGVLTLLAERDALLAEFRRLREVVEVAMVWQETRFGPEGYGATALNDACNRLRAYRRESLAPDAT